MQLDFKPEIAAKLEQLARESDRSSNELVEEALLGYFDELAHTRDALDRRYDELESGRVQSIDGEEALRLLLEKTQAQRLRLASV